jgi:hypothetical protein
MTEAVKHVVAASMDDPSLRRLVPADAEVLPHCTVEAGNDRSTNLRTPPAAVRSVKVVATPVVDA